MSVTQRFIFAWLWLALATLARGDLIDDPAEDQAVAQPPVKATQPSQPGLIHDDAGIRNQPEKGKSEAPAPAGKTVTPDPKTQAIGETKKPEGKPDKGDRNRNPDAPINFEGDNFSGDKNGGTVILEQNVKVTQDDLKIEADKATLKFDHVTKEVIEVVAVGNVRFFRRDPETGQPVRADSREAVFNNGTRTVVLKGDPKMVRGTDVVRGKQITYDLNTGWMKATRVEGVVQPTKTEKAKPAASTAKPAAGEGTAADEKPEATDKPPAEKPATEKGQNP